MSSANNTFGTPDNTVGTLNGFFKEVYASKLKDLIPDGVKLMNRIKFVPASERGGNLFHQPVILGQEHGITFAKSTDDAFNLAPAIVGRTQDAEVRGSPAVMVTSIGYTAASRATTDANSFGNVTKVVVANLLRSFAKKIEIEILYGKMGYATVASVTTTAITITTAEWAPGIWAGAEQMPIEIRSADGSVSRGTAQVASVDMDNRVVTTNAAIPGVIATDVIWHAGAYGNEFPGIHYILQLTTGTLFNIDIAAYNMFRANQYSASGGALSFAKLNLATARAVEKGLEGTLLAVCNPRAFANMLTDQAALRRYDGSYERLKGEMGTKGLLFHSQNGDIEIMPSIYVKEGYAFLLSTDDWMRVGSSEITFNMPGDKEQFFRQLDRQAGFELRAWTDQSVFCSAPARNVLITSIVNQQ